MFGIGEKVDLFVTLVGTSGKLILLHGHTDFEKSHELETRMLEAAECISSSDILPPESLQSDRYYVAKFQEDGKWYRAEKLGQVSNGGDSDSIEVKFVDYGNVEVVPSVSIRQCPKELSSLSPLANEFYLADIQSQNGEMWSADKLECVSELLSYVEFSGNIVAIHNNIPVIRVADPDACDKNMAERILAEGHGKTLELTYFSNNGSTNCSVTQSACSGQLVQSIPACALNPNEAYDIYVSYAESPLSFWIQLVSEEGKLNELMDRLSSLQASRELSQISIGSACLCVFSEDQGQYRGMVESIQGQNCVVRFVDYGNSESNDISELQVLDPEVVSVPQMSVLCCLRGVTPDLSATVIEKFQELVMDSQLKMKVVSKIDNKYVVDLMKIDDNGLILDLLTPATNTKREVSANGVPQSKPHKTTLNIGSIENVCVSYVDGEEGALYCHLLRHAMVLDKFVTSLNEAHSDRSRSQVNKPERGQMYAVKCLRDHNWCRGEIRDLTPGGALAFLVDFGHCENIPYGNIADLEMQFAVLPYQAVKCVLNGVVNAPLSKKQLSYLLALESKKVLVAKVMSQRGDAFALDLYDTSGMHDVYINALLAEDMPKDARNIDTNSDSKQGDFHESHSKSHVSQGESLVNNTNFSSAQSLFRNNNASPGLPQNTPGNNSANTSVQISKLKVKPVDIQKGDTEEVYITAVNGAVLSGQLTKCPMEVLDKLQSDLDDACSDSSPILPDPAVGDYCCARFTEDGAWYRGQVLSVTGQQADVCFIDYGNHELKPFSVLKVLPSQFIETSRISVNFVIAGLEQLLEEELSGIFTEQTITVRFVGKKGRCYTCCVTEDKQNAQVLQKVQKYLAVTSPRDGSDGFKSPPQVSRSPGNVMLPPRVSPKSPPRQVKPASAQFHTGKASVGLPLNCFKSLEVEDGEYLDVFVVFTNHPNDFYCQLIKNADSLQDMMGRMKQRYESLPLGELVCENIRPGLVCVARYPEDQEWYRAEIVNTSGRWVEAHFVDYGNREKVEPGDLKTIEAEFLTIPAQAIRCCLFGVLPSSGEWSAEEKKKFEMLVENNLVAKVESVDRHGRCMLELIDVKKAELNINQVMGGENFHSPSVSLVSTPSVSARASPRRESDPVQHHASQKTNVPPQRKRSNSSYLPEMDISSGEAAEVIVSWAISPHEFWCQLVSRQSDLDELMGAIHAHYSGLPPSKEAELNIINGTMCIAQFSQDKGWYRARVGGYHSNQVDVMFVDYGNTETVPRTVVKTIAPQFCQIPALAVKCSLRGVVPIEGSWPIRAATIIEDLATKGNFVCKFLAQHNDTYLVDMEVMVGGGSVADILCREHVAKHVHGRGSNRSQTSSGGASTRSIKSQDTGRGMRSGKPERPSPARTNDSSSGSSDHRGGGDRALPEWKTQDVRPKTRTQRRTGGFGDGEVMRQQRDVHSALGRGSHEEETEWGEETTPVVALSLAKGQPKALEYGEEDIQVDAYVDFTVTHVDNMHSFYCQLNSKFEVIDGVMEQVKTHFTSTCAGLTRLEVGQPCGAKFSEDQEWYRARVTALNGDQVTVCFVDYGNSEVVPGNQLRCMPESLLVVPAQGIHCCLVDLPTNVSADVESKFREMVMDKHLVARVCSKKGRTYEVELTETEGENRIIHVELMKLAGSTESAIPAVVQEPVVSSSTDSAAALAYKSPTFSAGSSAEGYLTHVNSPSSFFVQLANIEESLEHLTDQLQTFYSNPTNHVHPTSVAVGLPCCCKFSEDGAWYRGTVTEVHHPSVTVVFVDYGNADMVPVSEVLSLDPAFFDYPLMSVECSLPESSRYSDAATAILERCTSDKQLMVKFVSARPLVVQLFDGNTDIAGLLPEGRPADASDSSTVASLSTGAQFIPLDLTLGRRTAYVSHVESPSHFYVQLVDFEEQLNEMMDKVEAAYAESVGQLTLEQLDTNMPCCAKYSADGAWYRARIVKVKGNEIEVHFVDFGNTDSVTVENLRTLNPELLGIPVMAVHCYLDECVTSVEWADEQVERFTTMTQDKQLSADFVSASEPCAVKLLDGDTNIGSLLLSEPQPAKTVVAEDAVSSTTDDADRSGSGKVAEQSVETEPGATAPSLASLTIPVGQRQEVYVSHAESPDDFWCQLASNEDALVDLMEAMSEHYQSVMEVGQQTPQEGGVCAAKFSGDGEWYRAQVECCHDDGTFTVAFVDYGNKDVVKVAEVQCLDSAFLKLERQAFHCRLLFKDDVATTWGTDYSSMFQELISDKKLLVDVVSLADDSVTLNVKMLDVGISIESKLLEAVLARQEEMEDTSVMVVDTSGTHATVKGEAAVGGKDGGNSANEISSSVASDLGPAAGLPEVPVALSEDNRAESPIAGTTTETDFELLVTEAVGEDTSPVQMSFKYTVPPFLIGDKEEVYISNITNPSQFWVQLKKYLPLLELLMEKIFETYNSIESSVSDTFDDCPEVGSPCVAKFSEDSSWYRAQVVAVNPPEVKVFYVDYGNSETVGFSDIRQLQTKFSILACQAIECALYGVRADDSAWTQRTTDYFSDFVSDKCLVAEVIEVGDDDSRLVRLLDMGMLVSEKLITEKFAVDVNEPLQLKRRTSKDYAYSPKLVQGETVSVFVMSTSSDPSSFWCQLASSEEELPLLMDRVDEHYSKLSADSEILESVAPGRPCIAQYSEDGSWYRGVVTDMGEEDLEVCFVDYGNSQRVLRSLVKNVRPDLLLVPPQAFCCSLARVHPVGDVWDSAACTRFEELTIDKELRAEIVSVDLSGHVISATIELRDGENSIGCQLVEAGYASDSATRGTSTDLDSGTRQDGSEGIVENFSDAGLVGNAEQQDLEELSVAPPCVTDDEQLVNKVETVDGDEALNNEQQSKFRYITLEPGQKYDMVFSVAGSPDEFTCRLLKNEAELEQLTGAIQDYCTQEKVASAEGYCAGVGEACLALWSEDNSWYRGVVLESLESELKVKFVDYGNTDVIPSTDIRTIPDNFICLEAQGLDLKLAGVKIDEEWNQKAISMFQEFFEVAEEDALSVHVTSVEADVYYVYVYNPKAGDTLSINHRLLHGGYCAAIPGSLLEESGTFEENSSGPIDQGTGQCDVSIPTVALTVGQTIELVFLSVSDPDNIIGQLASSVEELTDLMDKLLNLYNKNSDHRLTKNDVKPGMYCSALYTEDDTWYRAEVVDVTADKAEVYFVDFGDKECVDIEGQLSALPVEFRALPAQAVQCSLSDVKPPGVVWLDDTITTIERVCQDKLLVVDITKVDDDGKVIGDVQVKDSATDSSNQPFSLRDILIKEGLAVAADSDLVSESDSITVDSSDLCQESPADTSLDVDSGLSCDTPLNEEAIPAELIYREFKPDDTFEAILSHVATPSQFWLQLDSDKLEDFMETMQESYSSGRKSTVDSLKEDVVCCVQYSEDLRWYRAKVQSCYDDVLTVQYVDYGNAETTMCSNVASLKPKFTKELVFAVQASLAGIEPTGVDWTERATEQLELLADDQVLVARVVDVNSAGVISVDLTVVETGESLKDGLVKEELARLTGATEES